MKRVVRPTLTTLFLAALVYLAARSVGPLPPLGPFLEPAHGVWTVATTAELPRQAEATVPGLGDSVVVVYDDRRVPHVFAASIEDAAAAIGYVMARDRLFQLEMQTRATEGTLSEVVGSRALDFDRRRRRRGLAWSARRQDAALDPTSEIARVLDAYAAGVNAWIDGLGPTDLPLEYHLLAVRPKRWERVHSLYLLREMGTTLSFSTQERWVADVIERVGWEAARALFPAHAPIVEPIVPLLGQRYPRFDDTPLPPPAGRSQGGGGRREAANGAQASETGPPASSRPLPPLTAEAAGRVAGQASNNWVVAPERSADGEVLLAGDPHLGLTLPSIWYEAHLVVPGVQDVYGVTLPGSPAIVIGFSRDVAWSFTNAQADLLDYYVEQVDDSVRPGRYLVDGVWRPLDVRIERHRNGSGRVIHTDTLYRTHRGPLVRWSDGRWVSLAWTIHEGGRGIHALLRAARAGSVPEWLRVMEDYDAVTQNGAVADRHGNIAILAAGRYPRRPAGVAGDTLLDGKTSAGDWQGDLDPAAYPRAVNPRQGYLASANQEPLDPRAYDRYLAADWPVPWRAMRINALLRSDSSITLDEMQAFQTDPGNERAALFAGELIGIGGADGAGRRATPGEGSTSHGERAAADIAARSAQAAALLAQWDRRYTKDNTRAVLFELAMGELQRRAWDELADVRMPDEVALWRLIQEPASRWWDVVATEAVETRDDVVRASLAAALDTAVARHGNPDSGGWRWDRIRHARIDHLLGLRSLSARGVSVQGGSGNLNPSSGSGTHGASWRMVVRLGDTVAARSIYPGGQSGNPVSRRYDDRIATWSEGQLEAVRLPRSPDALPPEQVTSTLILRPEGTR